MAEATAREELNRMKKAIALADLLQACGIDSHLAAMATDDDWKETARVADVNNPSSETQRLVIKMLLDREKRLKQFGMRICK